MQQAPINPMSIPSMPGMADAMNAAFGSVVADAVRKELEPLLQRIDILETQLQEYLDIVNAVKAKGGVIGKLLTT